MPKAKNARYLREKAGMTQQQFADAIGVSAATIHNWEAKKRAIPVPNAHRISEYFGVDYVDFCDVDLELLAAKEAVEHFTITESEMYALTMFREIPEEIKTMIRHVIACEYDRKINRKE